MVGKFLNAIIGFLLVSIGVYFFIVVPINKLRGPPPAAQVPGPGPQEKLLMEIRDLLAAKRDI